MRQWEVPALHVRLLLLVVVLLLQLLVIVMMLPLHYRSAA